MNLRRLEIQGFKTFAQKTVIEFVADQNGKPGLTAIVGPNGSGKSNIADAIRWVIGEQSMRLLRAKKSEDLIFSGTTKKARAGFAEVTMTIENANATGDELREIVITRRAYRDGKSEYEVNKKPVRLSDIVLLLAQSGLGQRTYSVIGQGMADRILSASPAERKEFFDEAAGLRPFQMKRASAEQKLDASKEKLLHAELILRELAPHLTSLERQAKRLQERDALNQELDQLETRYYGSQWKTIRGEEETLGKRKGEASTAVAKIREGYAKREAELKVLEEQTTDAPADTFQKQQQLLSELREQRSVVRESCVRLEVRAQAMKEQSSSWSPLPISKILNRLSEIRETLDRVIHELSSEKMDVERVRELARGALKAHSDLTTALEKPVPEKVETDPVTQKELSILKEKLTKIEDELRKAETALVEAQRAQQKERTQVFALQHEIRSQRDDQFKAEQELNRIEVDMARVGARKEAFLQDIRTYAQKREAGLDALANSVSEGFDRSKLDEMARALSKVRSRLEWIGGIDPAVLDEYAETKTRFDHMSEQTTDLKDAILSLQTVIVELDETIKKRAEVSFRLLNKEFGVYFKKLFGGGEAGLVEIQAEPTVDEDGNILKEAVTGPAGFDITANPPGKRMKSIALLSGGERALTSIALLCAIMATNPSPFVVLDEVDAALDESNSEKYGAIIEEFAERTQFVVITHNRATMNHAHVLYGVTMGDEGVSKLLSVKFEDILNK
ncbi:MAG: AAA family ATPase [bacterium]|nr:AAA family ATPase [bacterium]